MWEKKWQSKIYLMNKVTKGEWTSESDQWSSVGKWDELHKTAFMGNIYSIKKHTSMFPMHIIIIIIIYPTMLCFNQINFLKVFVELSCSALWIIVLSALILLIQLKPEVSAPAICYHGWDQSKHWNNPKSPTLLKAGGKIMVSVVGCVIRLCEILAAICSTIL